MAKKKTALYTGVTEAEKERRRSELRHGSAENKPDFIGSGPNYEKFSGWSCEKVLAWLNVD